MSLTAEGGPARSARLNLLAKALARFQGELDAVIPDEVATVRDEFEERRYRYATLKSVWSAIRPALAEAGLSIVQTCDAGDPGELRLTTTLLHTSGQWIVGTIAIPLNVRTPQAYGSALTYARRYGLAAIVGVAVDTDDDGALASGPADGAEDQPAPLPAPAGSPSAKAAWWKAPCDEASRDEWDAFLLAFAKATQVESVTRADVARLFQVPEGRELGEHFGSRPLGELIPAARKAKPRTPSAREPDGVAPEEPRAA